MEEVERMETSRRSIAMLMPTPASAQGVPYPAPVLLQLPASFSPTAPILLAQQQSAPSCVIHSWLGRNAFPATCS